MLQPPPSSRQRAGWSLTRRVLVHATVGLCATTLIAWAAPYVESRLHEGREITLRFPNSNYGLGLDGHTYRSVFVMTRELSNSKESSPSFEELDAAPLVERMEIFRVSIDFAIDAVFRDTVIVRSGWPWPAYRGRMSRRSSTLQGATTEPWATHRLILLKEPPLDLKLNQIWGGSSAVILVSPIWWGLARNLLVFAGCSLAVSLAWSAVRRKVRSSRGLCLKCSYNRAGLEGSAPCPECGATVCSPR